MNSVWGTLFTGNPRFIPQGFCYLDFTLLWLERAIEAGDEAAVYKHARTMARYFLTCEPYYLPPPYRYLSEGPQRPLFPLPPEARR